MYNCLRKRSTLKLLLPEQPFFTYSGSRVRVNFFNYFFFLWLEMDCFAVKLPEKTFYSKISTA